MVPSDFRIKSGPVKKQGDRPVGEVGFQDGFHRFFRMVFPLLPDVCPQFFTPFPGKPVQLQSDVVHCELLQRFHHKLTATKGDRPGETEVGEEQIAGVFRQFFSLRIEYRQSDTPQGEALPCPFPDERFIGSEGNFRGEQLRDVMSRRFCLGVTVSGGAGVGDGFSADGDHQVGGP